MLSLVLNGVKWARDLLCQYLLSILARVEAIKLKGM